MDITLVTSSLNDLVHGTSNDKKTGCGINLLKAENVTRYRRSSRMTDLKEITCEKCKERLAKEIIRSDKKEMTKLLKEEKQRQKMGLGDEGIVPLGNTTAKITKAQKEEPAFKAVTPEAPKKPAFVPEKQDFFSDPPAKEPEVQQTQSPLPQNIPGTNVAIDNTLSQFAINAPAPEPEQAPAPQNDDFLAQFAVQKPRGTETNYGAPNTQNDFLAQFAVPAQAPAQEAQQIPQGNDIMNMFAVGGNAPAQNQYGTPAQNQYSAPAQNQYGAPAQNQYSVPTPNQFSNPPQNQYGNSSDVTVYGGTNRDEQMKVPVFSANDTPAYGGTPINSAAPAPVISEKPASGEWDSTANQFFGFSGVAETTVPVAPTAPITDPDAPAAMAELGAAPTESIAPVEPPKPPVIDDIAAAAATAANVLGGYNTPAPAPAQKAAPVIDDLNAAISELTAPAAPAPVQQAAPVIDDLDAALDQLTAPAAPAPAPVQQAAPVIDDLSAALNQLNTPAPAPVQPAAPVQQAAPVQPAAPVRNTVPVQPVGRPPQPSKVPKVPYKKNAPDIEGQIVSVPQFTGLDEFNKPVYTYIQMQIVGFDENGQPKLAPLPGEKVPVAPQYAGQVMPEDEEVDILSIPPSEMTVGQRIAAAALAKGPAPATANISKIATNAHSRSTAQSFINAISVSKDYANQSLTDTQGLQARTKIIGSIEDVLAEMGDNSEVIKKQQTAAAAAVSTNISSTPNFQEFKPTRTVSRSSSRPSSSSYPTTSVYDNDMPLTRAQMKAKKKQDKIDAKFKKEMAKRGL